MKCAIAIMICLLSAGVIDLAHAGWWSDWCERNLIAADPYQFREAPTSWIEQRIYYIEVKQRANMLSKNDRQVLKVLKQERQWRKEEEDGKAKSPD